MNKKFVIVCIALVAVAVVAVTSSIGNSKLTKDYKASLKFSQEQEEKVDDLKSEIKKKC